MVQLPINDLVSGRESIAIVDVEDLNSLSDKSYELESDTGLYMPKMVSQPLATPELLNDSVCFCEDFCSKNCVSVKMNDPVLQQL